MATYAVIEADGFFGDVATVMSTHRTREAACRAARPGGVMRWRVIERPGARKGDKISRSEIAVVVQRDESRLAYLDGSPVWPPHGRSNGAARWR